uniref:Uncharacterized protein n=1 Tax=Strigamia maritima TaxID=126957 RepID=T1JLV7_STRMM
MEVSKDRPRKIVDIGIIAALLNENIEAESYNFRVYGCNGRDSMDVIFIMTFSATGTVKWQIMERVGRGFGLGLAERVAPPTLFI